MGNISKNFNRSEFACKDGCGFDAVDVELLSVLEGVRSKFGPVKINSACRCEDHNHSVGGTRKSQHVKGKAADIVLKSQDPIEIFDYLDRKYPNKYGLGDYDTFTHIDVRKKKARW